MKRRETVHLREMLVVVRETLVGNAGGEKNAGGEGNTAEGDGDQNVT